MSYDVIILIVFGVAILVFGIAYLVSKRKVDNKKAKSVTTENKVEESSTKIDSSYKKSTKDSVEKADIFNFMEFDKIQDDMIIQQKGEKYTAVIKCKGINYNLMSEVEQLSVEEGFMTFLNTLKFPVQLYVQAQTVNLKSNIDEYKENMRTIHEEYDEINTNYNAVLNSLESTDEEIDKIEGERRSILNVLEYGQDIVKYVERLTLNKSMLQRSFYVLVSYYKSELSNASSFNKEELLDICYSELFTRVQNIISGLSMCSVAATVLKSNDIAELLYSAYNRDDKNFMSVQQALDAGFYRLYSTSEDAITKKNKKIIEGMKQEAEYKAIAALNKAIEDGTFVTKTDAEDMYDQETSKKAIEIVQKEAVPEKVKQEAKKIIVDEYKKAKKERLEKQEENISKIKEEIEKIRKTSIGSTQELTGGAIENPTVNEELKQDIDMEEEIVKQEENNSTDDDESIV